MKILNEPAYTSDCPHCGRPSYTSVADAWKAWMGGWGWDCPHCGKWISNGAGTRLTAKERKDLKKKKGGIT